MWAVAMGLLAACELASVPRQSLAKSRENAKRERSSEQAARSATLLASHGEPGLAWDALRAAGSRSDKNAALAARLLTELHRYAQAESVLARSKAPKDESAARWYTVDSLVRPHGVEIPQDGAVRRGVGAKVAIDRSRKRHARHRTDGG